MVEAQVLNGGDNFWNLNNGKYEVPKGSGKHSIFAQSLWIGGLDAGNNVHLAAMTYRQTGTDFWPGPLSNTTGEPTTQSCLDFDRIWKIDRFTVEEFKIKHGTAGYVIPQSILDWPGNGDISLGHDPILAPFEDVNSDGIYNPHDGDYPKFADRGSCNGMKGDQVVFKVYNDIGNVHTESGALPLGIQVKEFIYSFLDTGLLGYQTFVEYHISNKSNNDYHDVSIGNWVDPDLGNYLDDYVGCHVVDGLAYAFNGDNDDEGAAGYGINPPAVGSQFLGAPLAIANDGLDNDFDGTTDEPGEQLQMSGFVYYNNVNGTIDGNPAIAADFYNYLSGLKLDGSPFYYAGDNTKPVTKFMFPGNSDPTGIATGGVPQAPWSEVSSGNTPADRRYVATLGPLDLDAGAEITFTSHFGWSRAASGGATASRDLLITEMNTVAGMFDACFPASPCPPTIIDPTAKVDGMTVKFHWKGFATSINWTFGDGNSSSDLYPTHTYSSQGSFTVNYTATGPCGIVSGSIVVEPHLINNLEGPHLIRIEGSGNGGQQIDITGFSENQIVQNFYQDLVAYKSAQGPILVYTTDKSSVPNGDYELKVSKGTPSQPASTEQFWRLVKVGTTDTVFGNRPVTEFNNQYSGQYGLWIRTNGFDENAVSGIGRRINDFGQTNNYINFVGDIDQRFSPRNWVLAGTDPDDMVTFDDSESFESQTPGWAPYRIVSDAVFDTTSIPGITIEGGGPAWEGFQSLNNINDLPSIKVVFTSDQTKWTRAAVLETGEDPNTTTGGALKLNLRKSPSVDKSGVADGTGDGFGWFPGYAINVETGERLCILFGENSSDPANNGADMRFNPSATIEDGNPATLGGRHYIYISNQPYTGDDETNLPYYSAMTSNNNEPPGSQKRTVFRDIGWVSIPVGKTSSQVPTSLAIHLDASAKFDKFVTNANQQNNYYPRYGFNSSTISVIEQEEVSLEIYPNPTKGQLQLNIAQDFDQAQFSLVDLQGKMVFSEMIESKETSIDLSHLAKGAYIFVLDVDGNISHGKQVIQ